MNPNLSRRALVRMVCFLSAAVLALSAAALLNGRKARMLERQTQAAAEGALHELCTHLDTVTTALQKARYVNSTALLSRTSDELSRAAACAKGSLSALTNAGTDGGQLFKFLSQVGDFTRALEKNFQKKKALTAEQREALEALWNYARAVADGLHGLDDGYDDGSLRFGDGRTTLTLAAADAPPTFDDSLNHTAEALSDTPTLLYDGPFSDTRLNRKALGVASLEEIDRRTARSRAAAWLDCKQTELQTDGDTDGALALYCFSRGSKRIGITQRGGLLAYVTNPGFSAEAQVSPETAVKIAAKYLAAVGYPDMQARYYSTYDGVCTVVFHFVREGVVYYADLIKVSVALDSAAPVAMDARGFLMNHTSRKLPKLRHTPQEAAAGLAPALRLLDSRVALVPLDDGTEVLCYELHCRDAEGQEILLYKSATTLEEVDLQLLLFSDDGVLAK